MIMSVDKGGTCLLVLALDASIMYSILCIISIHQFGVPLEFCIHQSLLKCCSIETRGQLYFFSKFIKEKLYLEQDILKRRRPSLIIIIIKKRDLFLRPKKSICNYVKIENVHRLRWRSVEKHKVGRVHKCDTDGPVFFFIFEKHHKSFYTNKLNRYWHAANIWRKTHIITKVKRKWVRILNDWNICLINSTWNVVQIHTK